MASSEGHAGDGPEEKAVVLQPEPMAPIEEEEDPQKRVEGDLLGLPTSDNPTNEPTPQAPSSSNRNQEGYGFKKWLKSMKSRKNTFTGPQRYVYGWPENEALDESYNMFRKHDYDRPETSSIASSSILRAVKTASVSFTSFSSVNRLHTSTRTSTRQSGCHSSGPSGSDARASMDSNALSSALSLDESAWNRAVQRRQIIREILETETTYVAGLKSLTDVRYATSPGDRSACFAVCCALTDSQANLDPLDHGRHSFRPSSKCR